MEQALSLILGVICGFLSSTHLSFVYLLKKQKLGLNHLFMWLLITIVSIIVAIIGLIYHISNNITLIFPIIALIGVILLAIALIILIHKSFKKSIK